MYKELIGFLESEEIIVFLFSCVLVFLFFKRWYMPLLKTWPAGFNSNARSILGFIPVVFFILFYIVLNYFASFDVVDSNLYKLFYIVLGFAWVYTGLLLVSVCFGIIWPDDAVHLGNKSALVVIIGEFFALSAIYVGANIGDGPGWWCVLFAGSLGLAAWVVLGFVYHFCTDIFERITVDRDLGSGIRFCFYLVTSGIILGYACSGDWTSFSKTIEEFQAALPVLPLTLVMILIELYFQKIKSRKNSV